MINVTVWNEFRHEKSDENVKRIYPDGIHKCIADFLGKDKEINVRTATLDEPMHGLTDEVLDNTDVIIWWGHAFHHEVSDEIAAKVHQRVLRGMGFIALHSCHVAKPFIKLIGTSGALRWRTDDFERLWVVSPSHPIAEGLGDYVEIEDEEMYGEAYDIPTPDELVFISWFRGGEVFRSGCCWNRGRGKVFYFRPGHESNPTYHVPDIQKIITNAVKWAAPKQIIEKLDCPFIEISPEAARK
ncbi:MAG: ThuA domain-containing protein [Oscillospiraceae bacterium]|nr:ThuA domain-containing protein [Oscillospiraceae bacterium]